MFRKMPGRTFAESMVPQAKLMTASLQVFASSLGELFSATSFLLDEGKGEAASVNGGSTDGLPIGTRIQVASTHPNISYRGRYGFISIPPKEIRTTRRWHGHIAETIVEGVTAPLYWITFDQICRTSFTDITDDIDGAELTSIEFNVV